MKHIIITFILSLVAFATFSTTASAQWSSQTSKADAFLGTKEVTTSAFLADNGDVFAFQDYKVIIQARGRVFPISRLSNAVPTKVGFYKDGNLVEQYETIFVVAKGDHSMALCDDDRVGAKIVRWLKSIGEVRIYAKTFATNAYDVTIPMYKNVEMKE